MFFLSLVLEVALRRMKVLCQIIRQHQTNQAPADHDKTEIFTYRPGCPSSSFSKEIALKQIFTVSRCIQIGLELFN